MKDWAISKGALYYAHVFYPMTNATPEKSWCNVSKLSDAMGKHDFGSIEEHM
jgi:glutamine synthetase